MIHCGDSELTPAHEELQGFHVVKGNCDYANFQDEIVTDVDGIRFLVVHGHRHNVKMTLQTLAYHAEEVGSASRMLRTFSRIRCGINRGRFIY